MTESTKTNPSRAGMTGPAADRSETMSQQNSTSQQNSMSQQNSSRTRRGVSRRTVLTGLGAAAAAGLVAPRRVRAAEAEQTDPKFLIVFGCFGGASIIDAAMAIRRSESNNADNINCFEDSQVQSIDGSPFRAVDQDRAALGPIPQAFSAVQSEFVKKHHQEMMVSTWTRTSVNHAVGQARAVTGNDAWRGRTLQEAVANAYGERFALPNVHLASGVGYAVRGLDTSLPAWCFGETVADPGFWPLSLDGQRGIPNAPTKPMVERARALRARLESQSTFRRVFARSARLKHFEHLRGDPLRAIEAENLVDKLMMMPDGEDFPLAKYGIAPSPDAERLMEAFPNLQNDPLEAQAAMAFLVLKNRLSVSVTIGPNGNVAIADGVELNIGGAGGAGGGGGVGKGLPPDSIWNPPISFDFSHQASRSVQAFMWNRVYRIADTLIGLLKSEEWAGGESLWDRSLIYFASDFGRTKNRPAGADEFGSGHDLNNGVLCVSPLVRGNTVLGGVDGNTGLTYGFDPDSGAADVGRTMEEAEIYAGILHALDVDTSGSGLKDMRAMRKA